MVPFMRTFSGYRLLTCTLVGLSESSRLRYANLSEALCLRYRKRCRLTERGVGVGLVGGGSVRRMERLVDWNYMMMLRGSY